MPSFDIEQPFGFQDIRQGRGIASGGAATLAEEVNYRSLTAVRARLTALNAAYFTSARMDVMTDNDLIYALRATGDLASIK
jgi:hypothetical protein